MGLDLLWIPSGDFLLQVTQALGVGGVVVAGEFGIPTTAEKWASSAQQRNRKPGRWSRDVLRAE